MRHSRSYLLHPLFIAGLLLLILNDHWLKYTYHNAITGKLSDFAGVFVLAIFLTACLRGQKTTASVITAILFIYWKLPVSQPLINWSNSILPVTIHRVVDYTDLAALTMLIPAYRLQPFQHCLSPVIKWTRTTAFIITIAAICATSARYNPPDYTFPDGYIPIGETYKTRLTTDRILYKLDSMQISYYTDSVMYFPAWTRNYFLRYQVPGDSAVKWQALNTLKDTAVLYRKEETPFYVIPSFILEKDTVQNIRFRITDSGKKREIELISLCWSKSKQYKTYELIPILKKYNKLLKSLLLE